MALQSYFYPNFIPFSYPYSNDYRFGYIFNNNSNPEYVSFQNEMTIQSPSSDNTIIIPHHYDKIDKKDLTTKN